MVFIVRHAVNECRTDAPEGQLRLTPSASALQSPVSTIPGGPPCPTIILKRNCATGTVVDAFFCEQEDAHSYFLLIQGIVQHLGVPVALYTDRHAVFKHTPGSGLPEMPTQFSRAMEELGIQMIFAQSPQAKGRVERTAGTFQDRLVTELRLAGARQHRGSQQPCWSISCRDSTGASRSRRNTLSRHSGLWTRSCVWTRFCASNTAERWPRTTR